MTYYVYVLASEKNGTLYIGVTNDLPRRVYEHQQGLAEGFTKKHGVKRLVYFERHDAIEAAIKREKKLKHWRREWKLNLIERDNPDWRDLSVGLRPQSGLHRFVPSTTVGPRDGLSGYTL